ncbi:MAG: guanine deaminase [Myxococcota bacterium]|nr:guanine deaminase [Myxococcota bacterium]
MTIALPIQLRQIRGTVLIPLLDQPGFKIVPDALIAIDDSGRISSVEEAANSSEIPETRPGCVWMPGFVDTHLHFPQSRVVGSASGPLLQWLEETIFPEEARFVDAHYARTVADEFCQSMLCKGTVAAAVYSSSNAHATQTLFEAMARVGLRGLVGLTLMDRMAPQNVILEADSALGAARELAEQWHGYDDGRLEFCVTPRFAISCTPKLLRGAAKLAHDLNLPVQTHISENQQEIDTVLSLFPGHKSYLDVYAQAGLLDGRSILAHCIHLSDDEWDMLARSGCSVSHCPDSNFFLGSGQMPLHKLQSRHIEWGLGTDVGAGRTFSLRRIAASAYDTALLTESKVTAEALLWYASRGGAKVLGMGDRTARIEVGYEADFIAVQCAHGALGPDRLFDSLIFQHDRSGVDATFIRGRRVYAKSAS